MPDDNQVIEPIEAAEAPKEKDNSEMENAFRLRLKQANAQKERELGAARARIQELEAEKMTAMVPPQNAMPPMQPTHQQAPPQGAMPSMQGAPMPNGAPAMTAAEWQLMQAQAEREQGFVEKLKAASEKDKEFEALLMDGKGKVVPDIAAQATMHLGDAAPAVIKQLLKDGKSNGEMMALLDDMQMGMAKRSDLVRFMNNLSDKIESSVSKPHAPNFEPPADLSDIGDTGQDYDVSDLVSSHR